MERICLTMRTRVLRSALLLASWSAGPVATSIAGCVATVDGQHFAPLSAHLSLHCFAKLEAATIQVCVFSLGLENLAAPTSLRQIHAGNYRENTMTLNWHLTGQLGAGSNFIMVPQLSHTHSHCICWAWVA
jgi:hypothetical protein